MAIIKCKMCGGDIELAADKTFGTCEFCGSTMTLPKVDDDQRAAAFNRGNHFRRIGEFDKALAVYERIVREDDTDAEAHWCCALCRFGIEYVEDPATYEYLPTCHRASFDSFLEDVDYLAAVEHSEGITKRQYQKDGAKIAEVQRGILATSQNEEPFDVFICYKESDENGERTRDSLMAQDVYYQLTDQGYRVFFARITLEDVVGKQYEPYIFAALNSAKVMIAIGTKPEYMNAVWVKNEWSRFLAMMKKDRHKILLPCYKDMDPYDMPEQLSVLQSYDMSKIGFIQDLTRGIKKVLDSEKKPEQTKETVVVQQTAATPTAPLLQRAFMFLEDGEWNSANEYCEKVLDMEPQNAMAYVGKLMVDLQVTAKEKLSVQKEPFDKNANYLKAVRFGDDEVKKLLSDALATIQNRTLELKYRKAANSMKHAQSFVNYSEIAAAFRSLGDYKDSAALAKQAEEAYLAGVYEKASQIMDRAKLEEELKYAISLFENIESYQDSENLIVQCKTKISDLKAAEKRQKAEQQCRQAVEIMESALTWKTYSAGLHMLEILRDYEKAQELTAQYQQRWDYIKNAAQAVWEDYQEIHKKFAAVTPRMKKAKAALDQLNKDHSKTQALLQEVMKQNARLAELEDQIKSNQAQLAQANNELSSLGVFAFSKKRELFELITSLTSRCARLEQEIADIQRFINTNGTEDVLKNKTESSERSIRERNAQLANLNEELRDLDTQMESVLEKMKDRQIIAVLSENSEAFPTLVDEMSIAMVIKDDPELMNLIRASEFFSQLPTGKQKALLALGLDVEAVYYQACQAMDEAGGEENLRWAIEQFRSIENYKDSRKRMEACKARLYGECEMCGTKQTGRPQGSVAVCKMCGHKQTWG